MPRTATVKFRGEDVDVFYTDHGYESDTNSHVIDWDFGPNNPLNEADITAEEDQAIYDQLIQISRNRESDHHEGDH